MFQAISLPKILELRELSGTSLSGSREGRYSGSVKGVLYVILF